MFTSEYNTLPSGNVGEQADYEGAFSLPKGLCTQADKVQRSVAICRMFLILDIFHSVRLPPIWNLKIRNNVPNPGGFYRLIRNKIKY